jgi:hypothetical protein
MEGLTLDRAVHQSLRMAFERDDVGLARTLVASLSARLWLTEGQITDLVDALSRCSRTHFDTIESARMRLVGRWQRARGKMAGQASSMVSEAEYYFSMGHEFEHTVTNNAGPGAVRKTGLYVIEDSRSILLVGNDGSSEHTLFRVDASTLMLGGGVFWR